MIYTDLDVSQSKLITSGGLFCIAGGIFSGKLKAPFTLAAVAFAISQKKERDFTGYLQFFDVSYCPLITDEGFSHEIWRSHVALTYFHEGVSAVVAANRRVLLFLGCSGLVPPYVYMCINRLSDSPMRCQACPMSATGVTIVLASCIM